MSLVRKITPFIAAATLVLAVPGSASATDWRQFRYDIAQTGSNESETILSPTTVDALQLAWSRSVGAECVWAAPLVVGNKTIMAAEPSTVAAYATSTGRRLWTFDVPVGMPQNALGANAKTVFVSTLQGPLYALDVATGEVRWQRDLGSVQYGGATVSNSVVYATGGTHLYALHAFTGATVWSAEGGGNISYMATPSVAGGRVILGTHTSVRAYSQATGSRRWTHTFARHSPVTTAISGKAVYAASGRIQLKMDLATGHVIWQKTLPRENRAVSTPAVGEGLVVLHIDQGTSQEVYTARSSATGQVVWSRAYASLGHGVLTSSPAIANGVVYVGAYESIVRAFEAATGRLLWDATLDGAAMSSPSIVNGQLEIGTGNGTLYAFRLPSP